jgi:hypothetical protein
MSCWVEQSDIADRVSTRVAQAPTKKSHPRRWNEDVMVSEADLVQKAQSAIGPEETVLAAGVFGLQDNYAAIALGGVVSGAVASELPGGAMGDAVAGAAGIHMTRQVVAANKGVTVRMLVAVTDTYIHLFALGNLGSDPERELMRFTRASTQCHVSKFGASRQLKLRDEAANQEIGLTGSAAFFSAYTEGDKAVLTTLNSDSK